MAGLFDTLSTLKRAMNTQQAAINTTSHNMSNVNTEGYSRQRVDMTTSRPYNMYTPSGIMQLGTGVDISSISRIRDMFLDVQIRDEYSNLGKYEARDEFASEIETITLEPSSDTDEVSSLSELIGSMWDSWQDAVNNPQNINTKTGVVEASLSVTNELNHLYKQLSDVKSDSGTLAKQKVESLNSILSQIDDLSRQITSAEISGGKPNDLLDKRDLLVDKLSEMMDIDVDYGSYDKLTITTSNYDGGEETRINIFDELGYLKLNYDEASNKINWYQDADSNGLAGADEIKYTSTLDRKGGMIAGYVSVTQNVTDYQDRLNALSKSIATAVNIVHNSYIDGDGNVQTYDEGDANYLAVFTDGSDNSGEDNITAGNITVNESLRSNSELLRLGMQLGSEYGEPVTDISDTRRALAIAQLKDAKFDIDGILNMPEGGNTRDYIMIDPSNFGKLKTPDGSTTVSMNGFYEDFILKLGSFASESKNMTSGEHELINELLTRKDSISGVNGDEETVNMIEYQHALNAAFKTISIVDELLQSVLDLIR